MKTPNRHRFEIRPSSLNIGHIFILLYSIFHSYVSLPRFVVNASQSPFMLLLRSRVIKPLNLRKSSPFRRWKQSERTVITEEDCILPDRRSNGQYKPCNNELTTENYATFLRDEDEIHIHDDESSSSSYSMIRWNQEECKRSLATMAESDTIVFDGLRDFDPRSMPLRVEQPKRRRGLLLKTIHSMSLTDLGRSQIRKVRNMSISGKKQVTPKTTDNTKDGLVSPSSTTPVTLSRKLVFWENMICGAISRSVAQTTMHPANTMKTILQSNRRANTHNSPALTLRTLAQPKNLKMLTRGAGAQFVMSVPHGAVNFAVLEYVRRQLNTLLLYTGWSNEQSLRAYGPTLDFLSSAISTFACSIVSTPQMMITDNIMAGTYPNFLAAISGLTKEKGIAGFYTGWWPGLAGKIPSYALTWSFFQQLKETQLRVFKRPPKDIENSIMGCMAGGLTVCIMIPMDTIKTRLVTQLQYPDLVPYKGILDCALRITKEEGIQAFYRGLTPRLISVVPMIGIQFGVYEFMKKVMVSRSAGVEITPLRPILDQKEAPVSPLPQFQKAKTIEEVIMEVAADDDQPFPAPHRFDEDK